MILAVRMIAGTTKAESVRQAQELAKKLGIFIEYDFNNTTVFVGTHGLVYALRKDGSSDETFNSYF